MRYIFSIVALFALHASAQADDAAATFQKRVAPLLQSLCTDCHSGAKAKAKLDLAGPRSLEQLRSQGHQWFSVLERVEAGTMPPEGSEPLKPAKRQALAAWVRGELTTLLIEQQRLEGRSKFRRLSRTEYANTVQDVFGIRPPVVRLMPVDGRVDGYDRVSAALPFSTASTEAYLKVADDMVTRMFELADPLVLRAQTERLLTDPKSERFVKDFLDQWLGLWGIDNTTPDKDLYPEYDDLLKFSSVMETQATFRHMLDKNRGVRDFVAPQWGMVNDRLARHYGFPAVEGFAIREVKLPTDTPFGGIWTQAATMKVTANGTLTSPVKRGVWVAERLLGTPIPPPPANIDPVDPDTRGAKTLREQLALHSGKGSCAACHARFDPYGFALESFDVMGNFRTNYRVADPAAATGAGKWTDGLPVDSTGVIPQGKAFAGVKELREMLAKNPAQLARGVTRHLLTYATGQPATPVDQPAIEAIVEGAAKDDYGLRSLVHGVVQSELFRSK